MLWFGLSHLLGGIGMLVPGAISLAASLTCPSPYYLLNNQCCNNSSYYSYSNYCYTPATSGSMTSGIVLLCVGFVSAIVGIGLLCKACKFYRNNNETCCWMICLSLFYQTIYRWLGVIKQHSQYFSMPSLAEKLPFPTDLRCRSLARPDGHQLQGCVKLLADSSCSLLKI